MISGMCVCVYIFVGIKNAKFYENKIKDQNQVAFDHHTFLSSQASGSVGSACSDIQQSSMFSQSPTTLSQAHGTPPLGQASGKRHPPSKAPVILKPGVPDGTEV